MLNKFYIGSKDIADCFLHGNNHMWTESTVESAIKRAKEKMIEEDLEGAIIVQIIRVLKVNKPPISVEIVK
jgi:hypothetical protein